MAEDGRGPSIWDTFSHTPGTVVNGETGDVACDHYHRWPADLDLLADLGVGAYRFSVAWPRIQPTGSGRVEQRGLDFYRRLLDGLRDRGITPFVTLYHWDLPQALEDAGGWRVRETAERFADYAGVVARALGEFQPYWITLNEPYCSAIVGYAAGPARAGRQGGSRRARRGAPPVARPWPRGAGAPVARRRRCRRDAEPVAAVPLSLTDDDIAAARRQDLLVNRLFLDPLLAGAYPADYDEVWGHLTDRSFARPGDLAVISTPVDFLGVNYYFRIHVRKGACNGCCTVPVLTPRSTWGSCPRRRPGSSVPGWTGRSSRTACTRP